MRGNGHSSAKLAGVHPGEDIHGETNRTDETGVEEVQPLPKTPDSVCVGNSGEEDSDSLPEFSHLKRSTREIWRRGRDSNPRYPFGYSGFQDRPFKPLTHLSAERALGSLYRFIRIAGIAKTYPATEVQITTEVTEKRKRDIQTTPSTQCSRWRRTVTESSGRRAGSLRP